MADHDSPVSIHGGGTLAKQIVTAEEGGHWPVPEGTILASGVRRIAALTVDIVIVTTILMVATGGQIIDAWNLTFWGSSDFHYSLAMAVIILAAHWLYWRLTGLRYSRSLGQRMFGIAVLAVEIVSRFRPVFNVKATHAILMLVMIAGGLGMMLRGYLAEKKSD